MNDIAVSKDGVIKLLKDLNPSKALGPDELYRRVLKELATELGPVFAHLFQQSIDTGEIPKEWSLANICPLDLNYNDKLLEIRKLPLNWSKRLLTPLGRITVIKSLALSKINHLILALPNPSTKIIDELQKMFYGYLWNKGPDKIKRTIAIQNYENGGLRMIEVATFMKSLKLTLLRRILLTKINIAILYMQIFPA